MLAVWHRPTDSNEKYKWTENQQEKNAHIFLLSAIDMECGDKWWNCSDFGWNKESWPLLICEFNKSKNRFWKSKKMTKQSPNIASTINVL